MASISSSLPTLPYLALPAPSSSRAGATGAASGSRAGDPADLPPVEPVQPITRRAESTDDAPHQRSQSNGETSGETVAPTGSRGFARSAGLAAATVAQSRSQNGGTTGTLRVTSTRPSTGFLTQRLSQETLGTGLHIEPWQTALSSYRTAAALSVPLAFSQNAGMLT